MNIKWFLRGLGVGIVVTALLLCITYRNTRPNNNVIQEAKELGMVFPEKSVSEPAVSAEDLITPVPEQETLASGAAVTGAAVTAESEEDKKAREKLDKSGEDIGSASVYQGKTRTFVVRSGLLSSSVAREMEEAGIIKDADAFDEFIEKNGYGRLVRSGKYKIPKNADFETIAKIITRQD